MDIINDSAIFELYDINSNSTFKDLIDNITNYSYNEIKLDPIYKIDEWLTKLLKAETFLYITTKRHRDHLLHACRIAGFGEMILHKEFTYNDKKFTFLDYVRTLFIKEEEIIDIFRRHEIDISNDSVVNEKILQAWYISSLFHDIGYIYEAFTESWKNLEFLKNFPNFKQLNLDIDNAINNFQKDFIISNLHTNNSNYNFVRKFDHGKIGACIISNLVGESNPVCEIASLITDGHTSNEKIEFNKEPLRFLLALLDEIQEWQRPVMGRKITDQALSEKISMYSPYVEKGLRSPELDNIFYSFLLEEIKPDKIIFNLNFELNFGSDAKFMDRNNFSLPMMLYLKYKNFQRLRVNKNTSSSNDDDRFIDEDLSKFNLDVYLKIISDFPLSHLWDRQCNILFTKSSAHRNSIIADWLQNTMKYRNNVGQINFRINNESTPRMFDADFSKVVSDANDIYLRDSYIKEKKCTVEIEYKKGNINGSEHLKSKIKVNRTIVNSSPDMPINGFYACFDEFVLDKLEINSIKVNQNEIKDVFKQELPVETDAEKEKTYRENYAVFIPFKSPLTEEESKELEYEYSYATSLDKMKPYDAIFNGRGKNTMNSAKLIIKWDKKIFNTKYQGCILFDGKHKDMLELLEGLKQKRSYTYCKENFQACKGELNGNEIANNFIEFKYEFKNIKPYNMVGFAWLKNDKTN